MAWILWRVASGLAAVFFAWAAAMQLNDPDPARWFALYAAAAGLALAGVVDRARPAPARVLGAIALIWAAAIVPELWGRWSVRDLGAAMGPRRPEVEYGREFCGLLIVGAYCFALARVAAWRCYMRTREAHAP